MKKQFDKCIWALNAVFNQEFHFDSKNNIIILGHDTYNKFMDSAVIFPNDLIIQNFISKMTRSDYIEFLIVRNNIKKLKNYKLVKYLDSKDCKSEEVYKLLGLKHF